MLVTKASAKVNWTLEVLGRRADGYHDVATVMVSVNLCDELRLTPASHWQVTVDAPPRLRAELEGAGGNLVQRALQLVRGAASEAGGARTDPAAAHLHLIKRIPAAAGLGGGSSDAAATLRLVAAYWRLAAPDAWRAVRGQLPALAAALGSDVPFFLRGGVQLATGRGERLTYLSAGSAAQPLVILTPPYQIEQKTARLYGALSRTNFTDGRRSRALAARLSSSSRPAVQASEIVNAFEDVAAREFPGLREYQRLLSEAVGSAAHLCGAGPSLFALAANARAARAAAVRLRREGHQAIAVHTTGGRAPAVRNVCPKP